ncbi:MFS transporter [Corynebacterium flavescens]|uniref:MFS transporter n=1 Tax=Corynebacterium flavescens TaxID=28028 RepID=UPI0026473BF5|nr:MFS transporter [Corynebacterium flavescens]MDN6476024.1 MFS transporter [Corynebacterium flavescens]MDN6600226.1 MFS transporter [Corynebacterium flavescens]MDN6822007.1 MFS transporter [Corynebacterium flavescens]
MTVLPPVPPNALPSQRDAWKAMFALSVGFFVSLLDQTMVAVALSGIQHDLGASINQVMWVSAVYLLAVVVPLLFTGRLGDIYGQRTVFRIGITLFGIGAVACALAPNIEFLIVARVVQGLGASIQMPQTMSVINRVFARERRGRALGVWGIVGSVATLTGPLLGGFLVSVFGWQSVFWVHVPFAFLAVVLVTVWVPALPTTARQVDYVSVGVSLLALGALVFGIQQGPEVGWTWKIWLLLAAGAVFVGLFVWLQSTATRRGTQALVPLQLFGDRNYSAGSIAIVAMGFMAASMMLPLMFWLQDFKGLNAGEAGALVAPMAVVSMVLSPAAGALADKLAPRILAISGFSTLIVALAAAAFIMGADLSALWLLIPVVLLGVGQSFVWGSNAATTMRDVPPRLMGAASGVYNTSRQLGSVLGVAVASAAMQMAQGALGLVHAVFVIVVALLGGLVASLFFRDTLHSNT